MRLMKKIIQIHIYKGDKQFVAEGIDFPVVTQGKTLDELSRNVEEAINLMLEGENPADFGFEENPSVLASMELSVGTHAKA